MAQKPKQLIVVSMENYRTLRELGNITESFNDVVTRVLEIAVPVLADRREKALMTPEKVRSPTGSPKAEARATA